MCGGKIYHALPECCVYLLCECRTFCLCTITGAMFLCVYNIRITMHIAITRITTHTQAVAAGRAKTSEQVQQLLHGCVWDVQALVEQGWLDGLLYEDELVGKLQRAAGMCVCVGG